MNTEQRQTFISTLANSTLSDIKNHWNRSLDDFEYETIRHPKTGMVMAVGRTEATGEPFNLGEVTVTRCALRLISGETGIGYVMGSDQDHAMHIALLDAVAQHSENFEVLDSQLIKPLQKIIETKNNLQQQRTATTKVDFLTMVRGED